MDFKVLTVTTTIYVVLIAIAHFTGVLHGFASYGPLVYGVLILIVSKYYELKEKRKL
jgi:hypothetical protein